MKNFWLQFAIREATSVAAAFVASVTNLTPAEKEALENFIAAGQAVTASFTS
jgi:hypothetical protein